MSDIFSILSHFAVDESLSEPLDSPGWSHGVSPVATTPPSHIDAESAMKGTPQGNAEAPGIEVVHGEPLTDRKSTFQAHVAEVHSVEEVSNLYEIRA